MIASASLQSVRGLAAEPRLGNSKTLYAQVWRAVLCPPLSANECTLIHHDGAHGVTRPTFCEIQSVSIGVHPWLNSPA